MNDPETLTMEPEEEEIIVRADEVDETGADVSVLSAATDAELTSQVEERSQEMADISSAASAPMGLPPGPGTGVGQGQGQGQGQGPGHSQQQQQQQQQSRPGLRREGSAPPPPPPKQSPPPAPGRGVPVDESAADSLSLAQLRNIVSNFQRMEPTAYAYTYQDSRTFAEEIEEWFQYTVEDRHFLRRAWDGFTTFEGWSAETEDTWFSRSPSLRRTWTESVVSRALVEMLPGRTRPTLKALQTVAYIALGMWRSSAGRGDQPEEDEEPEELEPRDRGAETAPNRPGDRFKRDASLKEDDFEAPNDRFKRSLSHIYTMRRNALLLANPSWIQAIYLELQRACGDDDLDPTVILNEPTSDRYMRIDLCMTILYVLVETGRWESKYTGDSSIRRVFEGLKPNFLGFLSEQIARIRWDEDHQLQLTRFVQLLWKGMLLILGSTDRLDECKRIVSSLPVDRTDKKDYLMATPVDYHIFRQEITSKYPAYNPPPPLVPLEPENTSLLPPLPRLSRSSSQSSLNVTPAKFNKSIFEQPVHITTPIPSPPPSPAGPGGKGGKKQNYQTNQSFPFLYPASDGTGNDLGGKGGVASHVKLVGKRWEGSDVPASIVEAGELFASHMRLSRANKQMWAAREACIKYDRGWDGHWNDDQAVEGVSLEDIEAFDLDHYEADSGDKEDLDTSHIALIKDIIAKSTPQSSDPEVRVPETEDKDVQRRLDYADDFYKAALPHLQSIVIVVLKILLANISATGSQPGGGSSQPPPPLPQFPLDQPVDEQRLPRENLNLARQLSSMAGGGAPHAQASEGTGDAVEALNSTRAREVASKAIAGMLLTMLKWFRFSHVLKFQLLTQLLLDSNYLPLALKYFAMQDVDRAVDRTTDSEKLGFFEFCREDAGVVTEEAPAPAGARDADDDDDDDTGAGGREGSPESSEDEAQPPPIRRRKSAPSPPGEVLSSALVASPPTNEASPPGSPPSSDGGQQQQQNQQQQQGGLPTRPRKPEVDELGYPTTTLPQQPLTNYSARFFFTTIALLRVLQKVSKGHAHRALLLVQYKSSTILRKALKVPQPALRLYTLKLFKSQVPFCGRKWRQANMRVITAIYVFCRMGLRDDWISGAGAVDDWVENALSVERAWRGLTGWWHSKFYREAVGLDKVPHDDEDDFFSRELEKMGWPDQGADAIEVDEEQQQADWENGLLQPEGW